MRKYYFITYQAKSRNFQPQITYWNDVTDLSPMQFILDVIKIEKNGDDNWINFVVTFAMEISVEDYNKFKGNF